MCIYSWACRRAFTGVRFSTIVLSSKWHPARFTESDGKFCLCPSFVIQNFFFGDESFWRSLFFRSVVTKIRFLVMDNFSERIVKIYRSPYWIILGFAWNFAIYETFSFFRPRKDGLKFIDARIYWVKLAEIFVEENRIWRKKEKERKYLQRFSRYRAIFYVKKNYLVFQILFKYGVVSE